MLTHRRLGGGERAPLDENLKEVLGVNAGGSGRTCGVGKKGKEYRD